MEETPESIRNKVQLYLSRILKICFEYKATHNYSRSSETFLNAGLWLVEAKTEFGAKSMLLAPCHINRSTLTIVKHRNSVRQAIEGPIADDLLFMHVYI